jgi:hypothetical protein
MEMGLELKHIADLPTQVATTGALQQTEAWGDEIFEFTIGVVVIVKSRNGG